MAVATNTARGRPCRPAPRRAPPTARRRQSTTAALRPAAAASSSSTVVKRVGRSTHGAYLRRRRWAQPRGTTSDERLASNSSAASVTASCDLRHVCDCRRHFAFGETMACFGRLIDFQLSHFGAPTSWIRSAVDARRRQACSPASAKSSDAGRDRAIHHRLQMPREHLRVRKPLGRILRQAAA